MPKRSFVLKVLSLFLLLWILFPFRLKLMAKEELRMGSVNREGKEKFKYQKGI
jgi:hypothetical protein